MRERHYQNHLAGLIATGAFEHRTNERGGRLATPFPILGMHSQK